MLYSRDSSLEDRIVELSADGRLSIKSLHEELSKEYGVTLRAVYKAANKLIAAGVLLKIGQEVMVDQEWASRAAAVLSTASGPTLSPGEHATYTFTSLEHLDAFWKTVVLPQQRSKIRESFFYNPHDFWAYLPARRVSEDAYYRHFSESGRYGFFTVGGDSPADKEFKRTYQNDFLQIDLQDIRQFRRTDHLTILDSLIITVRLGKNLTNRIDTLYGSGQTMERLMPELVRTCNKPGKIRFILENNPEKANRLRKVLAKNFYIQQATKIPTV